MRLHLPPTLILFFICGSSIAQNFNSTLVETKLSNLSELEQIDYINSNFYSIYSADFAYSIKLTEKAIALSRRLGAPKKEALALKNYGIILYLTGDYEKALPAYLKSYSLYDSIGDKRGLAQLGNEMANYYQKQGAVEEAIALWEESEKLAKETKDLRTLGTTYGMLAAFHWVRKNYEISDSLYVKCYEIRVLQNDSVGLGYIFLDLADIARRAGDYTKAVALFDQSITIREAINDAQGVLESYMALAGFYFNLENFSKAAQYYEKTIEGSRDFGYLDLERKSLDSLSSIHYIAGNYKKSLDLKVLAENLEDSLFNLERTKVISALQTKHETEKKEQQIALQQAEISEQEALISRNKIALLASIIAIILLIVIGSLWRNRSKRKQLLQLREVEIKAKEAEINATISSQEKERSRYARDLHDGFGQMISILNMNLGSLKENAKPDVRQKVFHESEKVINEMYDELKGICFDLMPQTLIQNGLESALSEFTERINVSGKVSVELNTFGLERRLLEVQEISLYRISQEWINNVVKYSNAEKITLQITKDDDEITLLIEDDGVGFDQAILTKGKGNGWRNLNTRASLIKGTLELETTPNKKGSSLILDAPSQIDLNAASKNTLKTV